jgi:hypothetical protein
MKKFGDPKVAAVFAGYPPHTRRKLMQLRQLIFDVAAETEGVGCLEETLKWGQPSYLTTQSGSGTTIRIDRLKSPGGYALFVHCQTMLVDTFREIYRDTLKFEGNRSIVFEENDEIPLEELGHCIVLALTYHAAKRPHKLARRN